MGNQPAFMCPRCQIGRCQPGHITYVQMYEGMLLRVPNMLVYTCDICGFQEYSLDAMQQLRALVGEVDVLTEEEISVTKPSTVDTMDASESSTTQRLKP